MGWERTPGDEWVCVSIVKIPRNRTAGSKSIHLLNVKLPNYSKNEVPTYTLWNGFRNALVTLSYWAPLIKYCADQGLKETHMVPTVLKYGGFQFYSRWSKSTTTSFSLLMTQNWMKCKEQLPEDSESKQKQVDWEGESKLWRSISLALVALTWR